jgi:hypothetical protein
MGGDYSLMADSSTFYMKQHDTAPSIQAVLRQPPVAPATIGPFVDVTGATVTFILKAVGGTTPAVNSAAVVVTPTAGLVQYNWAVGDTAAIGDYNAEWQVIYPSGKKQTFPGFGYSPVHIDADLDGA